VTTLAAHAFTGDKPLFDAVMDVAANMGSYIERDGGLYVVRNPVQLGENFADRWASDPERPAWFFAWLTDLQETLESARSSRHGLTGVAAELNKRFGAEMVTKSVTRFGERRSGARTAGKLTVSASGLIGAGTTKVPDHTFHGDEAA
jgi:hypothetical protein